MHWLYELYEFGLMMLIIVAIILFQVFMFCLTWTIGIAFGYYWAKGVMKMKSTLGI